MQAVKATVSIALLWILFSRIDLDRFLAAGRHARPVWVAVALGLYLLAVLVSSWRWHRLLLLQDVKLPFWRTVGSFIVTTFMNIASRLARFPSISIRTFVT